MFNIGLVSFVLCGDDIIMVHLENQPRVLYKRQSVKKKEPKEFWYKVEPYYP